MLVVGTAGYMVALTIAQALIALHGHALVALGWGIAVGVLFLVTWLAADELYWRVELGLVSSSFAAAAVFAVALVKQMRTGVPPDPASLLEAAADRPYEA